MAPRSRHAVDPSLTAPAKQDIWHQHQPAPQLDPQYGPGPGQPPHHGQPPQTFAPAFAGQQPAHGQQFQPGYQPGYDQQHQQHQQQQQWVNPAGPQLHPVNEHQAAPSGPYAPQQPSGNAHPTSHPRTQLAPPDQQATPNYPPENHIPPPPHSAGPQLRGPRIRVDPSQMPDPIEAQELDQNLYDEEDFQTCDTHGLIPLAVTDYRGIDQGNSLPRHLRPTLPTIPSTAALLDTTGLPFSLVIQPFAQLRYDEAPIPLVSNWVAGESAFDAPRAPSGAEDEGPPRCDKCRAYINPWVRFTDGGRRWACNLCGAETPVPASYYSHLAPTGTRLDHQERPELLHGTVDFAVPREYWSVQPSGSILDVPDNTADALATTGADLLGALQSSLGQTPTRGNTPAPGHKGAANHKEDRRLRRPAPLGRVFILDVSASTVQRGVLRTVCEGISKALFGSKPAGAEETEGDDVDEEVIGAGERVGFVTVGDSVGFWNVSAALDGPQLLVVPDVDDMYCPLAGGFLVDPAESRSQVEALLTLIPDMYERQPEGTACAIGAAIKGSLDGLRHVGGQINFFLGGLPQIGPGKLKPRDDINLAGTEKEKALFQPGDAFWRQAADELAEAGVGVNAFVFPDKAMDLASVGALSIVTGGETFFHPRFEVVRDREIIGDEIKRVVVRETPYNATVRVRCSNGLRISEHTGNFYQRSMTDLEFGTLDEAKAFTATIRHEGHRLNDRDLSYIQVATLYTSASGERRVRVLNLSLPVSSLIGNVFRFADFDASVTTMYKEAVAQLPYKGLRDIRKILIERANRVLLMYRKHCAPAVQAGQLILPEGFKLLPLYTLCMIKSKPLKGGNVVADVRTHYKIVAKSASATAIMSQLYPRLLAIHDLKDTAGFPGPNGRLRIPRFMRASYQWMVADGAYLLVNSEIAMIWLGAAVNPRVLDDLYGVENLDELDTRITQLPKLPTLLSTQVRNLLTHLERIIGHSLPVLIVRQDRDGLELEFANSLIEDSNNDALSYADFLMTAHQAITNELSGKSDGWKAPWS